jgi:hypothetical protein
MLGSVVRRRISRMRVAAVATCFGSAACAATVAKPSAAAWGGGGAAKPPGDGSAPRAPAPTSPRSTHSDVYMKQALGGVLKHGMPSKENIKYRDGHCLAYDRATRNPRWVSTRYKRRHLSLG